MLTYTQDFNDAIRSTDREMIGWLEFKPQTMIGKTRKISGQRGLVSFTVKASGVNEERFCIGSTISSYIEATFQNSKFVNLMVNTNQFSRPFDVYIGVKGAYSTNAHLWSSNIILSSGKYTLPTTAQTALSNLEDTDFVSLHIGGNARTPEEWDIDEGVTCTGGLYTDAIIKENNSWVYVTSRPVNSLSLGIYKLTVEAKCLGRFYTSEITRDKAGTTVVAYDTVNKMAQKYVPTVTSGANGYLVMDILNDIIDQTGVNGGNHFTTTGNSVYITNIQEDATCKDQWGWLMALCTDYGECNIADRSPNSDLGYIEQRAYENGKNNYTNYPAIDDSVIYMDGLSTATDNNTFTISSLTTGTDDNPISLGSGTGVNYPNPYITIAHATDIFNNINGITYMPMTLHWRGDPCIEVMDSLKVRQGNTDYRCVAMQITSTYNGGFEQTIECWGDSESYYDMSCGQLSPTVDKVNSIVDFIVDRGSASGWVYRKWNTGYVECWRRVTYTKASLTITQNGSVYEADVPKIAYPFTFSSAPREYMELSGNANANYDEPVFKMNYGGGNGNSTTQTGRYKACSFSNFSKGISVDYYVRGAIPDHA